MLLRIFIYPLFLACIILWANAQFELTSELPAAACNNLTQDFIGKGAKFHVNGTGVTIFPQMKSGGYDTKNTVSFQIVRINEHLRGDQPGQSCASSNEVVKSLHLNECKCTSESYVRQSEDLRDEGIIFTMKDCTNHSNLVVTCFLSVPNKTFTETFNATIPGSILPSFDYVHPAGGIKIGLNISNWDYNLDTMDNDTFLSFEWSMHVRSEFAGSVVPLDTVDKLKFTIGMGPHNFLFTLEKGLILEGQGSISGSIRHRMPVPIVNTKGLYLSPLPSFQGLCAPPTANWSKWESVSYDPSLVSLFSPEEVVPSSPATTSNKRQHWVIPVGVTAGVGAIVAAVVLLAIFDPSFKAMLQPFTKRRKAWDNDTIENEDRPHSIKLMKGNEWQKAHKPLD